MLSVARGNDFVGALCQFFFERLLPRRLQSFRASFGLALLCVLVALPAQADQLTADALARKLGQVTSITAIFRQTTRDADGVLIQKSDGTLIAERPNRFVWAINSPFEQSIISDGEHLWIYDPDLLQAVRRELTLDVQSTPALLFSGDAKKMLQGFSVERAGTHDSFALSPRDDTALFRKLVVVFTDANMLSELQLVDNLGQTTLIELAEQKLNIPLDASRFRFVPPEGVDVIAEP